MVAINPPTTEVIQNDYVNPSFEDTTTSPLINSSWGAEGNCSIQIPPGSTYALPELLGGKALQIVPRNAGQNLLRRGELVTKNLDNNPSFEAPGATTEVRRNLAINPSFEAAGAAVEVRRNLAPSPRATELTGPNMWIPGWGTGGNGASDVVGNLRRMTWSAAPTGGSPRMILGYSFETTPGQVLTFSVDAAASGGSSRITIDYKLDDTWLIAQAQPYQTVSTDVNNPTRLKYTFTTPAGVNRAVVFGWFTAPPLPTVGSWMAFGRLLVELDNTSGDYFDGSTSPDPDLTPSWTGPVNASASVLTAYRANRVDSFVGREAIRSSKWSSSGTRSLRLIPTGNSAQAVTGAVVAATFTPGKTYTVLVTCHLETTLTGYQESKGRRILLWNGMNEPVAMSNQAPNAPGDTRLKVTFVATAEMATVNMLRLAHSSAAGSGDIWWDDLAIVEGDYSGEYFDGNTSPDPDLTPAWVGTPHASESTLTGTLVLSHYGHPSTSSRVIQSTQWSLSGSKSLRIIGSETTTDNFADIPGAIRVALRGKRVTIMATARLEAPLSGAVDVSGRLRCILVTYGGGYIRSERFPNEAGVYDIRWSFDMPADAAVWRLYHGHRSQDSIWWDNLLIVEGDYDGPYFDGANSPNGENSIVVWDGAAQSSASTLYSATKITARTAEQPVRAVTPGNYYIGEGQWDLLTITGNSYTGPPFSGATPPFEYKNQLVTPAWVGTPHKSASRFSILSVPPWTPTSNWDAAKNRRYRFGVDRGMLYLDGVGVPWSGLIRVDRAAPDNKGGRRYIDGRVFDVPKTPSDFGASLEAFIYPDEFAQCIGEVRDPSGLTYYDQPSRPFDLCYRTREGDGLSQDKHYRLHFAYGVHAIEDGESYGTSSATIDPSTFKWQLIGIPVTVPGHRHSSYFTISTRDVNRAKLEALEMVLYGANGSTPALPTPAEILSYLGS